MKPILGILLSACMVAGNSTLLIDPANAEPKIVKAGKGISKAGRTLPAALNTILSGTGTPSALLGRDGDFYIDRKAWQFFGPKIKGRWPLPVLLIGPTGSPGPTGAIGSVGPQGKVGLKGEGGSNGATGSATVTAGSSGPMGPSGPAGAPGPIGAEGAAGTAGVTGPAGPSGSAGSAGTPGATGATGSSGLPGPTGAAGSTGATGPQGLQGATGLTGTPGASGTVGPRGPSRTISGALIFSAPIAGAGGAAANANPFGSFASGTNYSVSFAIEAWAPSNGFTSPTVSVSVSSTFGSPVLSVWQNAHIGQKIVGATNLASTIIQAHAVVDGRAVAGVFSLVVTVTDRDITTGAPVSVDGYFVATQVETVT
jgi:hypothetical protein